MELLDQIASKHLGKAGDGSIVNPYVTPLEVDASLLVAVPRYLNRTAYGIENGQAATIGQDVWNCYEVSYLLANGYPVSCYVRIVYDSTSECIVESKSIKLYLNSFNMNRFAVNSVKESIEQVKHRIASDLTPILGVIPDVGVMLANEHQKEASMSHWNVLETSVNYQDMTFDDFTESPDLLEMTDANTFKFRTSVLRSNCRITNQPDRAMSTSKWQVSQHHRLKVC